MSVQQEPLKMNKPASETHETHHNEPPKLELANSSESLEAFGAALGGAILGVLATLLILAIINNGTLRFSTTGVAALDAKVTRIDENLGAVNHNVEVVAQRLEALEGEGGAIAELRGSLTGLDTSLLALDEELAQQGVQIEELNETRQNFEAFTAALAQALADIAPVAEEETAPIQTEAAPSVEAAEPVQAEVAPEVAEGAIIVTPDASLPVNAVQAYLFVDSNEDGVMDADEASLMGATIVLVSAEGEINTGQTTDTGILFEELQPGTYTVAVEDAMGYELTAGTTTEVTVVEDGEGLAVYFPVAAGE